MRRLLWQLGYAYRLLRSPYDVTAREAWSESRASWEMNDSERCGEGMPSPAEALYHDQQEWRWGEG